jgi:hypothetical protein
MRDGARINVEVSRRPLPGAPVRRIVRVTFLVDTGADMGLFLS